VGKGRFFRYGELPLVLLVLLERQPMSGYDLMGELDRLFGPVYRPSPGSVYPALKALAAEALISTVGDGEPARYRPTTAGHEVVRNRRDDVAAIEQRTGRRLAAVDDVEAVLARLRSRVTAVAGRVSIVQIERELDEAAERLEHAGNGEPLVEERA